MKKPKFVLSALCLVLGAGVADACTGMYAGKKVTTDGSVKPSDAAGFFSIGVKENPGVQPSDLKEPPHTIVVPGSY